MDIRCELIAGAIVDVINKRIKDIYVDMDQLVENKAIGALSEIQEVICDEGISDWDAIEQIVCIFEKYNINAGTRHDFG